MVFMHEVFLRTDSSKNQEFAPRDGGLINGFSLFLVLKRNIRMYAHVGMSMRFSVWIRLITSSIQELCLHFISLYVCFQLNKIFRNRIKSNHVVEEIFCWFQFRAGLHFCILRGNYYHNNKSDRPTMLDEVTAHAQVIKPRVSTVAKGSLFATLVFWVSSQTFRWSEN